MLFRYIRNCVNIYGYLRIKNDLLNSYYLLTYDYLGDTRLRHYAKSRKILGSIPDEVIGFLNGPNPSSRTMVLGSTQPPTEMSTRSLPGGKGRPAHKADNLTVVCGPIV
jgi:hypothetical protein